MSSRLKISLPLLAVVLLWSSVAIADTKSPPHSAEIQPVKEKSPSSAYPASPSNLFAIHHQAESGLYLLNRLPIPHSINDSQNDSFGSLLVETALQRHVSIYLRIAKVIDRSLTVKKLIFPFHFFL